MWKGEICITVNGKRGSRRGVGLKLMCQERYIFQVSTSKKRESALNGLRDGWALAKIQYHNDMWEVVKIYNDPPRQRAIIDPWESHNIESRGIWLESICPEELKVKDDV